jgi:hypothetical protein
LRRMGYLILHRTVGVASLVSNFIDGRSRINAADPYPGGYRGELTELRFHSACSRRRAESLPCMRVTLQIR